MPIARNPRTVPLETVSPFVVPATELEYVHAIAIRIETIPGLHGVFVSSERKLAAGESTHQHQQARSGQMEVREHCAGQLELETWADEEVGFPGSSKRHAFDCA